MKVEGPDSSSLPGAWAVLHRLAGDRGAPLDSGVTDGRGWYRLRVALPDTTALYVVSVSHRGVTYFTRPLRPSQENEIQLDPITVYDTSSVGPRIELSQRHLIIRRPGDRQGRQVLEILVLANRGNLTRIAPDTSRPVWQTELPRGAIGLEVGESDLSEEAVYRRGNSVAVAAPMPPGEKRMLLSYFLPGDKLELGLDQPVGQFNILAEDSTARLLGGPLKSLGIQEVEGIGFARFTGNDLAPGSEVILQLPSAGFTLTAWWWVIVALAGVVLLAALIRYWPTGRASTQGLEAQLEAIEAALAASGGELTAGELRAYRKRRAELKKLLRGSSEAPS